MNHGFKLHPDGTLEITMPKGEKVGRVFVCEEGTQNGGLYYPECDVPDTNVGDINKFIDGLEEIFADLRERHIDDSVCGLCEYDGAYLGQSGDWCNECPGFEKDDCFKLSGKIRKEWTDEIIKALPSASTNSSESPNSWIPCSIKKHPDSKTECYVTVKDYTDDYGEEYDLIVDVDTYYTEHDAWDYYCDLDIVAWMPKNEPQEPYQPKEDES